MFKKWLISDSKVSKILGTTCVQPIKGKKEASSVFINHVRKHRQKQARCLKAAFPTLVVSLELVKSLSILNWRNTWGFSLFKMFVALFSQLPLPCSLSSRPSYFAQNLLSSDTRLLDLSSTGKLSTETKPAVVFTDTLLQYLVFFLHSCLLI